MKLHAAHRLLATSDINPQVAALVKKETARLKKMWPALGKSFKGFDFERVNNPSYDPWERKVRLPIFGKDKPLAEVDREEDAADSSPIQMGLKGTLIHEYGHHVNQAIINAIKKKGDDEALDEWLERKRELEAKLGPASKYASKNTSEWFAEQFLAEDQHLRPRALLNLIDEFVQRYA